MLDQLQLNMNSLTRFLRIFSIILFLLIAFQSIAQLKCPNSGRTMILSTDLPTGFNELFAGSGECILCHNSMTNAQGEPIGILNDWRSTMMASAAKDPLWRAKVSHETLINPGHAEALEDVCSRCHAPLGNFNAHYLGQEYYSLAEMETDSLAMDGVSCTLCHQITSGSLGNYSGNLLVGTEKQIWGPYQDSFTPPMFNRTGYTPFYGEQVFDSQICGSCHTLLTNSVDLDGVPTGEEFVEQAIYHEWLNSDYPDNGQTCQSCHIPRINDSVKISTMPPWLGGRSPFGKHHFAGGNRFMQKILKNNIDELGITAEAVQFDSTISRTEYLLQEATLEINLSENNRTDDTLFLELELKNLAGHKFPGGFPSRRAFVEVLLIIENGDTIFHSGKMDENFNLIGEDETYEPHHDLINKNEDVQIYEMVMGDVNNNVTTVLERAYLQLKDNRLPPEGFTKEHYSYDTVKIAGAALADENFNDQGGNEGTGSDILFIHAPLENYTGNIDIVARVYYQTVSNKWLEDMFSYSSPEIDLWKGIYEDADKQPFNIGEVSLTSIATQTEYNWDEQITLYPNPASKRVFIHDSKNEVTACDIYRANGEKLISMQIGNMNKEIPLPNEKGLLLVRLTTRSNGQIVKKIILN